MIPVRESRRFSWSGTYRNGGIRMADLCESCMNYEYDEEYECYTCMMELDEDEMSRFLSGNYRECPYYQQGDEYRIVRHQM